jgi:putative oxidoreductase
MQLRETLFGPTLVNRREVDIGLLLLRIFAGLALALAHGWGKIPPSEGFVGMLGGMGLPAPVIMAWMAALAEFVGGLMLAIGLLTRPVAVVLVIHFLVVTFLAHAGDSFGDRELPLFFMFTALLYVFAGPGRYSVDAMIGGSGAQPRNR